MRKFGLIVGLCALGLLRLAGQNTSDEETKKLRAQLQSLQYSELIQSMTQRSLLVPGYFGDLKGLIARQAYNFWSLNKGEKLVSHLNVYKALHDANKYLGYDSLNGRFYHEILGHTQSVTSLKFNGSLLYSAGSDGRVMRWDLDALSQPPLVLYESDHLIRTIDITADGEFLMVVTKDQGLAFIDLVNQSLESMDAIGQDPEVAQAASFVPGENQYVLVNKQGEVKLKGFDTNEVIASTKQKVLSLNIHPASKTIYAGTEQGNLISWDSIQTINRQLNERFAINTLTLSNDLKTIAVGREKGDVILWDIATDKLVRVISGHQSAITDLDFSADDRFLLTASRDRTARVWDIANPRKLPIVLDDHNDWVLSASFDQSDTFIVTGSKDSYIRKWPLDPAVLADRICQYVQRPLTKSEWRDYIGAYPYSETCPGNP